MNVISYIAAARSLLGIRSPSWYTISLFGAAVGPLSLLGVRLWPAVALAKRFLTLGPPVFASELLAA